MSLELLDIFTFWANGGFFIVGAITLILLAIQAMVAYVLWRRGEKEYFRRLITYIFAIISIFSITYIFNTYSTSGILTGFIIFFICVIIALAIPIYIEIRDTWIKKEKGAEIGIKKEEKI